MLRALQLDPRPRGGTNTAPARKASNTVPTSPTATASHRANSPLAQRKIRLSSSQVYRLVAERPERLSLKVLMALLDILDCSLEDLIEPAAEPGAADRKKKAAGAEAGIGELRPRRARIHGTP
jgi:DNA-binding Xre family transcriptional regulator